jgi:3-hydroxyisobutyrate dehydrogenase-like beta-hydroxyacid dehydrogenase
MKTIGIIGTGIMGGGMAEQLLRKGYPVVVWNRNAAKTQPFIAQGATGAASPADLGSQADVIILVVRDDAAVREVVLGPAGALSKARPGTTFMNSSTVTPGLVQEVGAAIEARGCAFFDAPVTGSKVAAASGNLGFIVSGRPEAIEAQMDVLNDLGQSVLNLGALGNSAVFKLANNQLAATVIRALGESLALCEAAGLARDTVVELLAGTAQRVCGLKKDKIIHRDWSTDFALDLMLKDLDQAIDTAGKSNVSMPLISAARDIYGRAFEAGRGEQDFAVVVEPLGHAAR